MGFETLRVYQAAEVLDRQIKELVARVPRRYCDDLRQLDRAVGSVLNNVAEAYGSEYPGRKRYHLEVARGSVDESRAVLRRLTAAHVLNEAGSARACNLTSAIAKMLTAWIRRITTAHDCGT
jgi:four helix bundle protein